MCRNMSLSNYDYLQLFDTSVDKSECNPSYLNTRETNNSKGKCVWMNIDNGSYYCIASSLMCPQKQDLPLPSASQQHHSPHPYYNNIVTKTFVPYDLSTKQTKMNNQYNFEQENIYLDLSHKGLGMSIRGGIDSPNDLGSTAIYVSGILNGGAVNLDGRIQIGDILLEVNGISLQNVKHKQAVEIIVSSNPYLHFKILRPRMQEESSDIYEQITEYKENEPLIQIDNDPIEYRQLRNDEEYVTIELRRDENGFGFSLDGGIDNRTSIGDTKLYVSKMVGNGPAHRSGMVDIGDEIVAINDINLQRVPYIWAINQIRSSPSLSVFTIKKKYTWD